jgi:hypothetical protein
MSLLLCKIIDGDCSEEAKTSNFGQGWDASCAS